LAVVAARTRIMLLPVELVLARLDPVSDSAACYPDIAIRRLLRLQLNPLFHHAK